MTADYTQLEERIISGTGVLRFPSDKQDSRAANLYLDLIRPPSNRYINKNWNPDKGRLATLVFLRDEYVIEEREVVYPQQSFEFVPDISGQTLIAVKCAYEGLLRSYLNLVECIPVCFPTTVDNFIKDFDSLSNFWDECRIVCYGESAFQVRLMGLSYDTCNEQSRKSRKPKPPSTPTPPPVAPDEPVVVSPPYAGDVVTNPYPTDDSTPPLPPTDVCGRYSFTFEYGYTNADGTNFRETVTRTNVYGRILGVRFQGDSSQQFFVEALHGGVAGRDPGACVQPERWWFEAISNPNWVNGFARILSVVPFP
jgi:hypothetical protein